MRKMMFVSMLALVGPVVVFPPQIESEESREKAEWLRHLREAKSRRSSGLIVSISGAGIAAAGLALTATAGETYRYGISVM